MADLTLRIKVLGEFSFSLGDAVINDRNSRSGKIWLLLAYFVFHRERVVTDQALVELLWGQEKTSEDPANALKTILHRTRALLDELTPGFGSRLISRRRGGYLFAPQVPLKVDAEEFKKLCTAGEYASTDADRLACYEQAIGLYGGIFLSKLEQFPQVAEIQKALHERFLSIANEVIPLLAKPEQSTRLEAVCRHVVAISPLSEAFYLPLMRALIDRGEQREAAGFFEYYRDQLFSQQGGIPGEEVSALYREAIRMPCTAQQDMQTISSRLYEKDRTDGAFLCDYDFFKVLYRVQARVIARSGEETHIALLSVLPAREHLSRRSLDYCMENLSTLLCRNLRAGDVVARWGAAQYVVMLPNAGYTNADAVLQRLLRTFKRDYPHSPARLTYTLQMLEPYQNVSESAQ